MKNNIRITAVAVCLCLIAVLSVLTACNPDTYFDVTAHYDETKGTVTIASNSNDGQGESTRHLEGDTVTVTVTPNENYEVKSFTVNGTAEVLTEGVYVFKVQSKTQIEVVFQPSRTDVYLTFNDKKGNVTLTPAPANGEHYTEGEQVTVSVSAKENFHIKNVTLNGDVQTLTDGAFSFTVTGAMELNVNFAGYALPAELYSSLQGRINISGEYFYDATDDSEDLKHSLQTIYGQDDYIYNYEADPETGEIYYDQIFLRNPSDISKIALQIIGLDNTVTVVASTDFYNKYGNPFKGTVIESDFEYEGVGEDGELIFCASNPASADIKNAASAITGWTETIAEFLIYFKDGKATALKITTAEIPMSNVDFTYHSVYELSVTDHGTANVPVLVPFESVPEHDILVQALQQAQVASRYTVRHQSHELNYDPDDGDDHSDLDYYKYITEDTVFFNHLNWEYGYTVLNGHVYPFKYFPSESHVTTDDAVNVPGIEDVQATFELACAPELFEYAGNNTFVLRNGSTYAPYVLPAFGEGTDEPRYFAYGTSLTIIVGEDGKLNQIKFAYTTYGITEEVTLTYDFDSEIDLSYLDFENADHHSVLDPFIGEYQDDMGNYVVVDIYGFIINGSQAELVAYDSENGEFTAKWEDQTLYIKKLSQRQLLIVNDINTIFWTLNSIYNTTVTIPDAFKGHWTRHDEVYDETFDFIIQSHAVYYNGAALELLSYTMSEGLTATDGTNTYNIGLAVDEDDVKFLDVLIVYANGSYVSLYAEYVDDKIGIEIPEEYVGTYYRYDGGTSSEIRVDISYTSITINGKPFIPESYSEQEGFTGTYNGISGYNVSFGFSNDQLQIGTASDTYFLKRVQTIASNYVGVWSPRLNEVNAQIIITDMGIEIRYNGLTEYFDSDDFRFSEYGYTVRPSWSAFNVNLLYFIDRSSGTPVLLMYDNNEEDPMLISFVKTSGGEGPSTSITLPASWNGTYTGTFNVMNAKGDAIEKTLTIRAKFENGKAYLDIGDGKLKETVLVEYEYEEDAYELLCVELDGIEYFIMPITYGDNNGKLLVSESNHDDVEKRLLINAYLAPEENE